MSPELVWMAWTQPEHLKKWFTPAPWTTVDCEIDLRPGGVFRTVMRSPAIVMLADEESRAKHETMGFQAGWGQALEQLVGHVKNTRA